MKTTGEIIKELREKKNLTQEQLGNILGVKKSAIAKYESGRVTNLKRATIEKMSELFNVSPSYIMGMEDANDTTDMYSKYGLRPVKRIRVPLLGSVSCGVPKFADEDLSTYVDLDADINADFCLQANGDSMINASIYDGDYVFIKKQNTVNNGEIAVVVIDDEATLKRVQYFPEKSLLILKAENPAYKDLLYMDEDLNLITILGKAVYVQHIL